MEEGAGGGGGVWMKQDCPTLPLQIDSKSPQYRSHDSTKHSNHPPLLPREHCIYNKKSVNTIPWFPVFGVVVVIMPIIIGVHALNLSRPDVLFGLEWHHFRIWRNPSDCSLVSHLMWSSLLKTSLEVGCLTLIWIHSWTLLILRKFICMFSWRLTHWEFLPSILIQPFIATNDSVFSL